MSRTEAPADSSINPTQLPCCSTHLRRLHCKAAMQRSAVPAPHQFICVRVTGLMTRRLLACCQVARGRGTADCGADGVLLCRSACRGGGGGDFDAGARRFATLACRAASSCAVDSTAAPTAAAGAVRDGLSASAWPSARAAAKLSSAAT